MFMNRSGDNITKKMSEPEVIKDSAIKLFGRTISLTPNTEVSANDSSSVPHEDFSDHSHPSSSSSPREVTSPTEHDDKEPLSKELTSVQEDDKASQQTTEDLKSPTSPKTPSAVRETSQQKSTKIGEQSDVSQDKAPKKPDKILPCPRCNSMDTKFCYYNNYNVSQPRHFCKNCQRYWTAGGTMRNVPVGAGRRKNKNSCSFTASHYHQVMVPETLQTASGLHSAVLTFGSDSPLCDSMSSVLSLAEKTPPNHGSVKASNSYEKKESTGSHDEESVDKSYNGFGFPPQFPFQCSSTPWPYPMPPPAFYQPSYPVSFYPNPAYWGGCLPPSWRVRSISPQSSVNYQSAPSSGPSSPTLGKHSRDGDILFHSNSEKEKPGSESYSNTENNNSGVLIPKTLRIDDPNEAAKSSIWSTLGIKNENKGCSLNGGGIFKAFESKGVDKNHVVEASLVLQANPAALSRSLVFHERT